MTSSSSKYTRLFFAAAIILSFWAHASAHPGHGPVADTNSPLHYATSPLHWGELIAAMFVACLAAWLLRGTWRQSSHHAPRVGGSG